MSSIARIAAIAHSIAATVAIAFACTDSERAPEVTYSLQVLTPELDPDLGRALVGWRSIGIGRDDAAPDPIQVERVDGALLPADGVANRDERTIRISDRIEGFRLLVILAHEVGHVVLDTASHNEPSRCGIMGASDTFPCDVDVALACAEYPQLEVCQR